MEVEMSKSLMFAGTLALVVAVVFIGAGVAFADSEAPESPFVGHHGEGPGHGPRRWNRS